MTMMQMYWLTRMDGINALVTLVFGLSSIALTVSGLFSFVIIDDDDDNLPKVKRLFRVCLWIWAISNIGWFIPTTKEMAAILIVPKIVNNTNVQAMPDKLTTLAGEWLEELRPENVKKEIKEAVSK